MAEELDKAVVGVEGGADPQGLGAPAATSEAGTVADQATTPEIAPEIKATIDRQVQAALEAQREKFEGKEGDLAKLKSTKDKEIAKLRQQLRQQQDYERERAKAMLGNDPEQAFALLDAQNQALVREQQVAEYQEQMDGYIRQSLEDLGLDIEDEAAAKEAAAWRQRLMENPDRGAEFQHEIGKLRVEQEKQEAARLRKELETVQAGMDDKIKSAVAKYLTEAGITPDLSPGGTATKTGSVAGKPYGANIKDGIAAARKQRQ